jgi:predicted methyltransferase
MAKPGAPAEAFPSPDRPVADIVSPIWRNEKERDEAGEARQLVRLPGIKSGMTIADIGTGSGYYVEHREIVRSTAVGGEARRRRRCIEPPWSGAAWRPRE